MFRTVMLLIGLALAAARLPAAENPSAKIITPPPAAAVVTPPPPAREMRGAWIATVANIDWPSKPGLPVAQQKAELISLIDRAAQLHFNAVFFQVRSVADAMYASPYEPWSEYLTGTQGRAPEPFYDPLALAVAEAHKRGLQLHAWFNPFRARHPQSKSPPAANHVTQTRPDIVRHYGSQVWLDPGEPESQTRALRAVLDVVKRYDVDGVVFDDYFYPYPEGGRDFPDDASWKQFGRASGLSRDDWRRENVNRFIQKVSSAVHAEKPWVQFGVSPFGIWRPGVPTGIDRKALDAWGKIYADARLWLAKGWVDYLAPQLYWPISPPEHSFTTLLQWWQSQNPLGRHVYAGLNDAAVGTRFSADEIARQIETARRLGGDPGEIHYHLRSVLENPALNAVVKTAYAQPALIPASPWLDSQRPAKPTLDVAARNNETSLRWERGGLGSVQLWVLQTRRAGRWQTEIFPVQEMSRIFSGPAPEAAAVCAVDRLGNLSAPAVWTLKKN